MKGDLFMKRKVLVSMGMCLMLFFSFAYVEIMDLDDFHLQQ